MTMLQREGGHRELGDNARVEREGEVDSSALCRSSTCMREKESLFLCWLLYVPAEC